MKGEPVDGPINDLSDGAYQMSPTGPAMHIFEIIVVLSLAGAALTVLSRRIGMPYPALLALAGAGMALVPGTPTLVLDPQLALTLFVAPVLLDSAFDASQRDLRANWRPVASLALGAVVLTVIAVAAVARWFVPPMPWAVALALGAIVAPSDAAAATAVLQQLRPPHRLLVILEGESLFNDASALLIYRLAVGAALAGTLSPASAVPVLLVVTAGSVVLGVVLSRFMLPLLARTHDVVIATIVQFGGTFAVWIFAEQIHLSGILTMVAFAMASARRAPFVTPARVRIPSYATWEFAVFVLNVLAFILVGFQLKAILERVSGRTLVEYLELAMAVLVATMLARIAWVGGTVAFSRRRRRALPEGHARGDRVGLSTGGAIVVGWCGMRGIVTLATALALPAAFPFRDLIVFAAFSVVLGTLVIQGMTLRPLMNLIHLEEDKSVEHEVRIGRVEMTRAALSVLVEGEAGEVSDLLRRRYEVRLRRAPPELAGDANVLSDAISDRVDPRNEAAAVRKVLSAERRRLLALRADGTIGDTAFHQLEQELDFEELYLEQIVPDVEAHPH